MVVDKEIVFEISRNIIQSAIYILFGRKKSIMDFKFIKERKGISA